MNEAVNHRNLIRRIATTFSWQNWTRSVRMLRRISALVLAFVITIPPAMPARAAVPAADTSHVVDGDGFLNVGSFHPFDASAYAFRPTSNIGNAPVYFGGGNQPMGFANITDHNGFARWVGVGNNFVIGKIDWGDGSAPTPVSFAQNTSGYCNLGCADWALYSSPHLYALPGTYTITLTGTDLASGVTASYTFGAVRVIPNPLACVTPSILSISPTTGTVNGSIPVGSSEAWYTDEPLASNRALAKAAAKDVNGITGHLGNAASLLSPLIAAPSPQAKAIGLLGAGLAATNELSWCIANDPPDMEFTTIAQPSARALSREPLGTGFGLTQSEANAMNSLLANIDKQVAFSAALYTSLNRASGAQKANNWVWTEMQALAVAHYSRELARLVSAEPQLLLDLQAALAADPTFVPVKYQQFSTLASALDAMRQAGPSPDFVQALSDLGFDATSRQQIWTDSTTLAGTTLNDTAAFGGGEFSRALSDPTVAAALQKYSSALQNLASSIERAYQAQLVDNDAPAPGLGGDGGIKPSAGATPELDSLVLFAAGAIGFAGYALNRRRAQANKTDR